MAEAIFGIDLGTSSSCIALAEEGNVKILPSRQGYPLTPSLAAVNLQHKLLVGTPAKRQAVTNPSGTVSAFKRLLGRSFSSPEISQLRSRVSYHILPGSLNEVLVSLHGRQLSPVEIGAYILQELCESALVESGTQVRKAILTVPANYNEVQRQSTVRAAELAGLEVVRLMNEPTAAALAYGLSHPGKRRTIAIYDLGGGTFDVTIMAIEQDVYEVLATHGDTFLGGEDFDDLVLQAWLTDILRTHKTELHNDRIALARLREGAESVKIAVSAAADAEVDLPFLADFDDGPLHYVGRMTRYELEGMAAPLIRQTLETCAEALRRAQLTVDDLDDIVLIGGMTRMPAIQDAVRDFFGRSPAKGIHPEEAVASGAALYGATLQSSQRLLLDLIPQTLSVASGSICTPIIPRGSRLPAKQSKTFATTQDNQRSVKVRVVQGEAQNSADNVLVGVFEVTKLPPKPRGQVKVEVEFRVNAEGLLDVTATDLETGQKRDVQVSEALRKAEADLAAPQARF